MNRDEQGANHVLMLLNEYGRGGVINSPELARKMAEMILEDMEGAPEVARSRPFTVEDLGDAWHVKANPEAIGERAGITAWEIVIRKLDAQVITVGRTERISMTKAMLERPKQNDAEKN